MKGYRAVVSKCIREGHFFFVYKPSHIHVICMYMKVIGL